MVACKRNIIEAHANLVQSIYLVLLRRKGQRVVVRKGNEEEGNNGDGSVSGTGTR